LPELNVKRLPQLERMKPGPRIVSHDFDIAGVVPENVLRFGLDAKGVAHSPRSDPCVRVVVTPLD
jgi:hypothetical protein